MRATGLFAAIAVIGASAGACGTPSPPVGTALQPTSDALGEQEASSSRDAESTVSSSESSIAGSQNPATAIDFGDVPDFGTVELRVGDELWVVVVADEPEERVQGLQGVADMGDIDGMLFVFAQSGPVAFTMRNTLIPLDLGLFDEIGVLRETISMVPCDAESDDCPRYPSSDDVRWALESTAGRLTELDIGSVIDFKS